MGSKIIIEESIFHKIYGDDLSVLQKQNDRYQRLLNTYNQYFKSDKIKFFSTPGRTEIGGNHTDHNHGRVLAGSINLDSIAAAFPTKDKVVTLYSEGYDKPFIVNLNNLSVVVEEKGKTESLIRGVAARLSELNYKIGGFNAAITSEVLPGSGLSSSASIEVLIGTIFNSLFNNNKISPAILAKTGQYAENIYFGKPCGLMDQMACAMGGIIAIDFKNTESPGIKKIEYDLNEQGYNLLVVNTKGNHEDLTDDYASIPEEMKSVASELGKTVCRELTMEDLLGNMKILRNKHGDRAVLRAFHFLIENNRVTDQINALEENNFKKFLTLVKQSGESSFKWLQNIYSVKNIREQAVSLALAMSEYYITQIEEGACRVHGGGFAGTIQVFIPKTAVEGYRKLIEPVFGEDSIYILEIRKYGTIDLSTI